MVKGHGGEVAAQAAFDADAVRAIAAELASIEGPLIPILHAINDRFGHVAEAAVPVVADVLNLSRAEVHGVVTFYHDFRRAPAGRHVVKVCRAEACQSMGGATAGGRSAGGTRRRPGRDDARTGR